MTVFRIVPRKVFTPNTKAHNSFVREEAIWKLKGKKKENELFMAEMQRTDIWIIVKIIIIINEKKKFIFFKWFNFRSVFLLASSKAPHVSKFKLQQTSNSCSL